MVGDHLVVARKLGCQCSCEGLRCSYSESGGVFDSDPARHFQIGPFVERDEAFEIARLFDAGRIEPREWWEPEWSDPRARIEGIVAAGGELVLVLATEACSFELVVDVEGEGAARHLRLKKPVSGGCT